MPIFLPYQTLRVQIFVAMEYADYPAKAADYLSPSAKLTSRHLRDPRSCVLEQKLFSKRTTDIGGVCMTPPADRQF